VLNKRRFHRIYLSVKAAVHHRGNCYEGILGAISLGGAAITFNGSAMIPQGDECIISIVPDETQPPLQLDAIITNSSVYRIGVAFTNMDQDKINILHGLLKKLTDDPETMEKEIQLFVSLAS